MENTERKNRIERIRKTTDSWGYSHLNFDKMHDLCIEVLDNYVANRDEAKRQLKLQSTKIELLEKEMEDYMQGLLTEFGETW